MPGLRSSLAACILVNGARSVTSVTFQSGVELHPLLVPFGVFAGAEVAGVQTVTSTITHPKAINTAYVSGSGTGRRRGAWRARWQPYLRR
jgi:hypothetical protein